MHTSSRWLPRRLLRHRHELLPGLILKAMLVGRKVHRRRIASGSSSSRRSTGNSPSARTGTASIVIPSLEVHPDLETTGGLLGTAAHLPQGDEQRPLFGTKGDELDVGHAQDAAAAAGDGADDAPGIAIGRVPSTASTTTATAVTRRRRLLLVLDGEQDRLPPRVGAVDVQVEALVPRGVDAAGVLDARLVPHVVVPDGQIRPRGGRQVDVRERFGPEDVQAEDALGRYFRPAAAADPADGGADAHGRQFGEGTGSSSSAAVVTDLHTCMIEGEGDRGQVIMISKNAMHNKIIDANRNRNTRNESVRRTLDEFEMAYPPPAVAVPAA